MASICGSTLEAGVYLLCLQVDQDNSGEIDFQEFCHVITKHRAATAKNQDEADTLGAFVALGGNVSMQCFCCLRDGPTWHARYMHAGSHRIIDNADMAVADIT